MKARLKQVITTLKVQGVEISSIINESTPADGIETMQKQELSEALMLLAKAIRLIDRIKEEAFEN